MPLIMSSLATDKKPSGRPLKDESGKCQPLSLKLTPTLLGRLARIKGKKSWPDTLEVMADLWEGKEAPQS